MKEYIKISPFNLYKEAYKQYSEIVKSLQRDNGKEYADIEKINSFSNIFTVAETVIKQILIENDIQYDNLPKEDKNFTGFCSLLIEELSDKLMACKNIDFKILCAEKGKRNKCEHDLSISKLNMAVRCWNNVKKLLLLLDESQKLPDFEYVELETVNIQKLLSDAESFSNPDVNYVLFVDSIHDLNNEYLEVIANMNWKLVIDFDTYTDEGGLRSYCNNGIFKREYKVNLMDTTIIDSKCIWIKMSKDLKDKKFDFKEYESFIDRFYSSTEKELVVISLTQKQQHLNFIQLLLNKYKDNNLIRIFFPCCLNDFEIDKLEEMLEDDTIYWNYNKYWLHQMMKELVKYKIDLIPNKVREDILYLPGKDELDNDIYIPIDDNTKFNLEDYFDIVYIGCENEEKDAVQAISDFYNGGRASWQVFKNERYVTILEDDIYKDFKNGILKSLGHLPLNRDTVIFKIKHEAGFGGTTLSRQVSWDLHFKYPVLIVKKYKYGKITDLIINLYDNIVRKGILIVADENNITLDEIERLEKEIKRLDRRVALLIVQRERKLPTTNIKKITSNDRMINLYHYDSETIEKLKTEFKSVTVLSKEEIEKRENMLQELKKSSSNINFECPFIIGLYYLQENFKGIDEFVKKSIRILQDNSDDIDILNYVAFADLYGKRELPFNLITIYYKDISQSEITVSRIANQRMKKYTDLIIKDKNGNYRFKHYLLSYKFLDVCLGKSKNENSHIGYLKDISYKFIDLTVLTFNDVLPIAVQEILKQIYIKNKIEDIEDENTTKTFSQLINSIISKTDKEDVLLYLKDKYQRLIENINIDSDLNKDDVKFQNYLFLAHLWGHLARFYFKLEENYSQAKKCCEQAVQIMEKVKIDDFIIRHIYGDCYAREFMREIKENKYSEEKDYKKYIHLLECACEQYQISAENGNVQYGVLSEIELLLSLMIEIYEQKNIQSPKDYEKLNLEEREYKNRIEELFNLVTDDDLDFDARKKYNNLWTTFYSKIQFQDEQISIQFYENKYKTLKSQNFDLEELDCARIGLIHAILLRYKRKFINKLNSKSYISNYFMNTENDKDKRHCEKVLELLREGIESPHYGNNIKIRDRKTFYFKTWFNIAKFSDKGINEAIEIAHLWFDLENEKKFRSPLPSYYLFVLYFLRALEGNNCLEQSNKYRKLCYEQCKHYKMLDDGVVSTAKFRDYLCKGNKMNKIYNANLIVEPKHYTEISKIDRFRGKFINVEKSGIGEIIITEPKSVRNTIVYFRPKECGLGEGQLEHILEFSLGFTFERIEAINKSVDDLSNNINRNSKIQYVSFKKAIEENITVEKSDKIMELELYKNYRAIVLGSHYEIKDGFKYPHLIAEVTCKYGNVNVNIPYKEITNDYISREQINELRNKEVVVKIIKNDNLRNINASILSVLRELV